MILLIYYVLLRYLVLKEINHNNIDSKMFYPYKYIFTCVENVYYDIDDNHTGGYVFQLQIMINITSDKTIYFPYISFHNEKTQLIYHNININYNSHDDIYEFFKTLLDTFIINIPNTILCYALVYTDIQLSIEHKTNYTKLNEILFNKAFFMNNLLNLVTYDYTLISMFSDVNKGTLFALMEEDSNNKELMKENSLLNKWMI